MAHNYHDFVLSQFHGKNGLVNFDLINLPELVIIPDNDFGVGVLTIARASDKRDDLVSKQELHDLDVAQTFSFKLAL